MRRLAPTLATLALAAGVLTAISPAQAVIHPTPTTMASISDGFAFSLIIGSDGMPYGTGANDAQQLTDPNTADKLTLAPLTGLPSAVKAIAVSANFSTSLVLGSDHKVYGAGKNDVGQLTSLPNPVTTLTPLVGQPVDGVAKIYTSGDATLVISTNGTPYFTGAERAGRFGNAGSTTALTAIAMPAGVTALEGEVSFQNLYILGSDFKVYAMGSNPNGQGPGTLAGPTPTLALTQMPVYGNTPVVHISADDQNILALGSDGNVYGAGANNYGEIGTGGQHNGLIISPLTGMPSGVTATAVSEGNSFSLALGSDGRAYGMGLSGDGQLPGLHSTDAFHWAPIADGVPGDVTAIAAGYRSSLMTDPEGIVYGSGYNVHGQLTGPDGGLPGLRVLEGQHITNRTKPTISGAAQFSKTLTVSPGTWSAHPSEYAYQWKQNGVDIGGATSATYSPAAAYIGHTITVTVTAKRGRLADATATSSSTAKVIAGPALVYNSSTKPKPSGTLKSGHTLKISRTSAQLKAGFNPDATTLTYRWYRGSSKISGATHSTYKLTSKDKGKTVRVRIYGAKTSYTTGSYLTATVKIKK